ncbi:beta strand repeat-containing protein [Vibrio pectenicida]|uniref:beta strand repeat-containing protein n=1 Tax=Vibrio pectenicida TaxID=62763 RepID=UPI003B9C32CC
MNYQKMKNLQRFLLSILSLLFLVACGDSSSPLLDGGSGDDGGAGVQGRNLQAVYLETSHDVVPAGLSTPLRAIAQYEGGYIKDVTEQSSWQSSDSLVLSVEQGEVTANAAGDAQVTVAFEGLSAAQDLKIVQGEIVKLSVSPQYQSFPVGYKTTYQAELEYKINDIVRTYPVKQGVEWRVNDTAIANIDEMGNLETLRSGDVTIEAMLAVAEIPTMRSAQSASPSSKTPLSTTSKLKVIDMVEVIGVDIAQGDEYEIPLNGTSPLTAMVTVKDSQGDISLFDGSHVVMWASDDINTVTVDNLGQITGLQLTQGSPIPVTATFTVNSTSSSDTVNIHVLDKVLDRLVVMPTQVATHVGERIQLKAQGVYNDGSVQDLTDLVQWTSAEPQTVSVDNLNIKGQITGVAEGQGIEVQAKASSANQVLGITTVSVDGFLGQIQSVAISPKTGSARVGDTVRYQALATMDDGKQSDITSLMNWQVVGDTNVIIGNGNAQAGELQVLVGASAPSVSVVATFETYSASASLTINPAELQQVFITPVAVRTPIGGQHTFVAKGLLSDGSTVSLTNTSWQSNANSTVTIDATTGAATAQGLGRAQIRVEATLNGITKTASVPAVYEVQGDLGDAQSLLLQADVSTVPLGGLVHLTSEATMTDGDTYDVTAQAKLTMAPIGKLSPVTGMPGLYRATGTGDVTITSTLNGLTSSTMVTVGSADLKRIRLSPDSQMLPVGSTVTLSVFGVYGNGQEVQMSNSDFDWVSDSAGVAVTAGGEVTAVAPNSQGALITASQSSAGSLSASTSVYVPTQSVTALSITPSTVSIVKGERTSLRAMATLDGGQSIDVTSLATWRSDKPSDVAIVMPGLVQGKAVTTAANVSAELSISGGLVTGQSSVAVTSATLERLIVTPATSTVGLGDTVQYKAMGYYSDNSQVDLTLQASWQVADPTFASINSSGLLTAIAPGSSTVTASMSGVNSFAAPVTIQSGADIVKVTGVTIVERKIDIPLGGGYGLGVLVTYLDSEGFARTTSMPSVLNWQSSDDTVVTVTDNGVLSGLQVDAVGQTITARLGGVSDKVTVTVTDKVLTSLALQPTDIDLPLVGMSQQMQAIAQFDDSTTLDVTTQTVWSSDDKSNATISLNDTGLATAVADGGPVTITGTYSAQSSDAYVTVGNTNVSVRQIDLLPVDLDIAKGLTKRYQAIATLDDNSTVDVTSLATWSVEKDSSGTTVASFGSGIGTGELSALAKSASTVNVKAELHGVEGVGSLDVTDASLDSIVINPSLKRTVAVALPFAYATEGSFSDGTKTDVTGSTTFTSSDPAVMTFVGGNSAQPQGPGVTTITATTSVGGITKTAQGLYEVTDVPLSVQSLRTEPSSLSLPIGSSAAIQVIATLNTSAEHDVTSLVPTTNWTTNDASVAYKATGDAYTIESGDTQGNADLTVDFAGQSTTLPVTTTASALESMVLAPASQTLAQGMSHTYSVTGHYTDGTTATLDNSADLTWVSSDSDVTVVNGTVTVAPNAALSAPVTITATDKNGSGTTGLAVVHVLPAKVTQLDITPQTDTLVVGGSKAMTATATLSSGSTLDVSSLVDWTVDTSYLSVSPKGTITGVAETTPNTTTVNASMPNSGLAATQAAEITVEAAALINMVVVPKNVTLAKGLSKQYYALGSTSDGQNMQVDVDWDTGDNSIADIDTNGLLTAIGVGSTTVTATDQESGLYETVVITVSGAQIDPTTLTLSPDPVTVQVGKAKQVKAKVTLTDGTTVVDVTDNISLAITPGSGEAQALDDGWVHGITAGSATAHATLGAMSSNTIDVTIDPAVALTSISATPAQQSIEESKTGQPLIVTANYDDGTNTEVSSQASFTDPSTLVTFAGNVPTAGSTTGNTTVVVEYQDGNTSQSTTADITVTTSGPLLKAILISPELVLVNLGDTQMYKIYAEYDDGSTVDVTAQATLVDTATPAIVDITLQRDEYLTEAKFEGMTTLHAEYQGIQAQAMLQVTDAQVTKTCLLETGGFIVLTDGTKVACPLTKEMADMKKMQYDYVVTPADNSEVEYEMPRKVFSEAGFEAWCRKITFGGIQFKLGKLEHAESLVIDYDLGGDARDVVNALELPAIPRVPLYENGRTIETQPTNILTRTEKGSGIYDNDAVRHKLVNPSIVDSDHAWYPLCVAD